MARAKGACRALAMDEEMHLSSINNMIFDLTGVVRHVVEQRQLRLRKNFRERLAHEMRDDLAVGERAVDGASHSAQVSSADR